MRIIGLLPRLRKPSLRLGTILVGAMAAALTVVLFASRPSWLQLLDLRTVDLRFRARPARQPHPGIIMIGVDDASLKQIGHWPWRRDVHARMVKLLSQAGARAIIFDIAFQGQDDLTADDDLCQAAAQAGTVVCACLGEGGGADASEPAQRTGEESSPLPSRFSFPQGNVLYTAHSQVLSCRQALVPFSKLLETVKGVGFADLPLEPDATMRSVPLIINYQGRLYPHLVSRAVIDFLGFDLGSAQLTLGKTLRLPNLSMPVDASGKMLINYTTSASWLRQTYSYAQVLMGEAPLASFKDKLVFVGVCAPGVGNSGATPFGEEIYHTLALANAVNTILQGQFLREVGQGGQLALLVLFALLPCLAVSLLRPVGAGVGCGALLVGWLGFSLLVFNGRNLLLPVVYPVFALIFTFVGTSVYKHQVEQRERHLLRRALEHYLPNSVLNKVLADPRALALGGERREVTILSADVVGFTATAEAVGPKRLVQVMNEYFTRMAEIVLEHGGTLDKFAGDGLLTFFGDPLPMEDQADQAVSAAIEMQQALRQMREHWRAVGLPELRSRIGINSGEAIVGNLGAEKYMNYTVVGDPVNVACRLQGQAAPDQILVGAAVKQKLRGSFALRDLPPVDLKGKWAAVTAYEVCLGQPEN